MEEAGAFPRGLAGVTLEPLPTGKYEVSPPRCCKTPGCDGRLWCVSAIFGACRCHHNATRHEETEARSSYRASGPTAGSIGAQNRDLPEHAPAPAPRPADGRLSLSRACWPRGTMNCPQNGKRQDQVGGACLVGVRMSVIARPPLFSCLATFAIARLPRARDILL